MLNDRHIKVMQFTQKSNEVFLKTKQNIEAITKSQREQQLLLYKNLTDNINAIQLKLFILFYLLIFINGFNKIFKNSIF